MALPLNKRLFARLAGYDEGSPGDLDPRPVFGVDCCNDLAGVGVKKPVRLLGYDSDAGASTNIRPVVGVDQICRAENVADFRYGARLLGYDASSPGSPDIRPVYGMIPTCPALGCRNTLFISAGCPGGFFICLIPPTIYLHYSGYDSGCIPMTLHTPPFGPAPTYPQSCTLWDSGDCYWEGEFLSGTGATVKVYLLFEDDLPFDIPPDLVFLFPCTNPSCTEFLGLPPCNYASCSGHTSPSCVYASTCVIGGVTHVRQSSVFNCAGSSCTPLSLPFTAFNIANMINGSYCLDTPGVYWEGTLDTTPC